MDFDINNRTFNKKIKEELLNIDSILNSRGSPYKSWANMKYCVRKKINRIKKVDPEPIPKNIREIGFIFELFKLLFLNDDEFTRENMYEQFMLRELEYYNK
jgi:hypothetical protein